MTHLTPTSLAILACGMCTGCAQDLVLGDEPKPETVIVIPDMAPDTSQDMRAAPDESFDAQQMAYAYICSPDECAMQLFLIDVQGPLACLTSEDFKVLPAQAGEYIATAHQITTQNEGCPTGNYLVKTRDSCRSGKANFLDDFENFRFVAPCAQRFSWDESGDALHTHIARSGLISIAREGDECVFDFEIIFSQLSNYEGEFRIALSDLPAEARQTHCAQKK